MLFWADYYLRWWRLPIEERACRKTDLGGGDYYLRNSGLPPSLATPFHLAVTKLSIAPSYHTEGLTGLAFCYMGLYLNQDQGSGSVSIEEWVRSTLVTDLTALFRHGLHQCLLMLIVCYDSNVIL